MINDEPVCGGSEVSVCLRAICLGRLSTPALNNDGGLDGRLTDHLFSERMKRGRTQADRGKQWQIKGTLGTLPKPRTVAAPDFLQGRRDRERGRKWLFVPLKNAPSALFSKSIEQLVPIATKSALIRQF